MKCDKAQEFFSDYIENTLDRPMVVALETHLTGCEACSTDVADLRKMWTVLDQVPQVEPPADFVWRTTTRLQNELLNRREAERARPLPWWKRLTPVQSFGYATVAALLLLGIAFPVAYQTGVWGPDFPFAHTRSTPPQGPQVLPQVTAPRFDVQFPGQNGAAATVTITTTSDMPNARVVLSYLTPARVGQELVGRREVWGHPTTLAAGQSFAIPVQAGGAQAVKIEVIARIDAKDYPFEKVLLLPGAAQPTVSLQDAGPYFALQQVAALTGQALLADGGLTGHVTTSLQSVAPQQALPVVLAQTGGRAVRQPNGTLAITR